jgi:hypothetical protein
MLQQYCLCRDEIGGASTYIIDSIWIYLFKDPITMSVPPDKLVQIDASTLAISLGAASIYSRIMINSATWH